MGDHEELVRDRELHVPPGVGEQLGQLGFLGRRPDRLAGERAEQRGRSLGRAVVVGADDLGQRVELLERVALGDPLRAERDVDGAAALGEVLGDVAGRARDRRCCAGRRARPSRRCGAIWSTAFSKIVIDGPRNSSTGVPMTTTRLSVRSIIEPSVPKASRPVGRISAQELVGAGLQERHLAGGDPVERGLVGVVDADAQAGLGEGEAQGQADMAAAAEDDDVEIRGPFGHGLNLAARCATATGARWSGPSAGTGPLGQRPGATKTVPSASLNAECQPAADSRVANAASSCATTTIEAPHSRSWASHAWPPDTMLS